MPFAKEAPSSTARLSEVAERAALLGHGELLRADVEPLDPAELQPLFPIVVAHLAMQCSLNAERSHNYGNKERVMQERLLAVRKQNPRTSGAL
jgi:hypothetical protein